MQFKLLSYARVNPKDRIIFIEAVQMGTIEAGGIEQREASIDLVIEAEILIDNDELKRVGALPDVAVAMKQVVEPAQKQYKTSDWRAKRPVMRDLQWQQKPAIDYIINAYKEDIAQAIRSKLGKMPSDWVEQLMAGAQYIKDPKALQLSPTNDKKWRSVYSTFMLPFGSAEDHKGFLGKFATEFEASMSDNKLAQNGDRYVFQSTLTGFESTMKELDPYAGTSVSHTKIHGWDVADEPGYDKEVKSAIVDQLSDVVSMVMNADARIIKVYDDGKIEFRAQMLDDDEELPQEQPPEAEI
jgi:hypothetical protein